MRLDGEEGFLELERSELGESGAPPDEDVLLNVTVQASSYSAADQSWIVGRDWDHFLSELQSLDDLRQGRAVLEGASPEDFRLEFYSTDSAGHMAVRGHLGWQKSNGHFLQLQFGFSFEPDRLPQFARGLKTLRA